MLNALRKNANLIEDVDCPACGRPLLNKNTPCPYCKANGHTAAKSQVNNAVVHASLAQPEEERPNVPPATLQAPSRFLSAPSSSPKTTEFISWANLDPVAILATSMTVMGGIGMMASLGAFVMVGFFYGLGLLQLSLLLLGCSVLLKRSSAETDDAVAAEEE
jgi:hypothetical protein